MIYVRINASFEGNKRGDVVPVERTARIEGLLRSKYLTEVTEDGRIPARPSFDKTSVGSGSKGRTTRRRKTGGEPGEDPGTGGHGQAEVLDTVTAGDDGRESVSKD
jgi:hypothetical protein